MEKARAEAKLAIGELRALARGMRPALLAERGLAEAVRALAARTPLPTSVHVAAGARLPAAVETAAYFVAAEGLTNAVKHGGARRAAVRIEPEDDRLVVEVTDDGRGGADPAGNGLSGLRKRVEALDGTLRVASPPGGPTLVRALLREGLLRLLSESGFEVAAAVADGEGLVAAVEEHRPDVCVVDVRLPPTFTDEGVRAALEARRRVPGVPVLVLSQYVERTYAAELLSDGRGGVGYLLKERVADVREFVDAVRRVAEGGTAMDPEAVAQLLGGRDDDSPLAELTPRERDVLALMAEGRTNSAIAERLVVTEGAVEKHVSNIFGKLGLPPSDLDHRRVLAVLAFLNG